MTGIDYAQLVVASGSAGIGFSVGFVIIRWLANFIAGRIDRKEDRLEAGMKELVEGLEHRINSLTDSEQDLRRELAANREEFRAYQRETDEQLRECRRKHAESEAEVMQLRAMLQGYGDARQTAQLIMAAEKVVNGDKGKGQ